MKATIASVLSLAAVASAAVAGKGGVPPKTRCPQVAIISTLFPGDCAIPDKCVQVLDEMMANSGFEANSGANMGANDGSNAGFANEGFANDGFANDGAANMGSESSEGFGANAGFLGWDDATCSIPDGNEPLDPTAVLGSLQGIDISSLLGNLRRRREDTTTTGGEGGKLTAADIIPKLPPKLLAQVCTDLACCGDFGAGGSYGSCPSAEEARSRSRRDVPVGCMDAFIGDGICDSACMSEQFSWDGGDCA